MKKIKIVLLAAGSGKRFGGGKLEALVDGKPMYLHALEKISDQILPDHPVVVTGNPVIIAAAEEKHINIIQNLNPELGISHSIHLAVKDFVDKDRDWDAVMFIVCDQPWLRRETVSSMLRAYEDGILVAKSGNRKGNPVIFSKKYAEELLNLSGDVGGRQVMERHKEDVRFFEIEDEKELWDIDKKEQLEDNRRNV